MTEKRAEKNTEYAEKETRALLEILALGKRQIKAGKVLPVEEAFKRLRARKAARFPG